jgi:hypothetical protein
MYPQNNAMAEKSQNVNMLHFTNKEKKLKEILNIFPRLPLTSCCD